MPRCRPPKAREYYRADLVGMSVRNLEGAELGLVSHFVDMPRGAVMVTKRADGQEHWVLAQPKHLKKVDLDGARDCGGLAGGAGIEGSMKIEVVTLFPAMIEGALGFGIVARAVARGLLSVGTEDPRAHTADVHRTVDDRPYGGGPGMVMKPEPLIAAIRAAHARLPPGSPRLYLSAQGERFTQARAQELALLPGVLLGRGTLRGRR